MRRAAFVALLTLMCLPPGLPGQGAPGRDAAVPIPRRDPPIRLVSLHPAATEILMALGASELLVARMRGDASTELDGSVLSGLPSVGQMLTPNLEVLASVEPDLVIAWAGSDLSALSRVVERGGGRVETVRLERLSHVRTTIEQIGAWVGRSQAASTLAASFSATLARAGREGAASARPRVLWIVSSEPLVVAGAETLIHDVIEVAGGENAAASVGAPWPRMGIESIVAFDPDVLVWPEGPGLFPAGELSTRIGWRSLAAVEAGRVLVVDAELLHDAGPEIADAALDLARRLKRMVLP